MYEARTQEEIMRELQLEHGGAQAQFEGTFEYDVLAANALEFAKVEVELEQAYKAAFADTSWGEYLTLLAKDRNVIRKLATKAHGTLTVSGHGTVYAGTIFSTQNDTRFAAVTDTEVNGEAEIEIEAVQPGSKSNVLAETVTKIPMSIPGISSVINKGDIYEGYDEESDEDLLERYLIVVRTPATSGNKYHYYNWAMSVEGVGACRVVPIWNGPGTVRVIITDSNGIIASDDLCQKVWEYIETVRPIGADVTVSSPEPIVVNITADILGEADKEKLVSDINAYLRQKGLDLRFLSEAQIIDRLMNQSGVIDCGNVYLNGVKRILVADDETLTLGEVTFGALADS